MQDDETKAVLEKLVEVVEFLCQETASLVDDYACRVTRESIAGVRGRANEIREAAQGLRTTFDTSGGSQGR
jgi:hypothetical protein